MLTIINVSIPNQMAPRPVQFPGHGESQKAHNSMKLVYDNNHAIKYVWC